MADPFLLNTASLFDVHKWSDYEEVNKAVDLLFEEIKTHRAAKKKRIRETHKVKRHLKVVIIDLWAAAMISSNPYRGISKNKTDYQRNSRYRKIHLKYDYLMGIVNDLKTLGYVGEKKGSYGRASGKGRRTRIWATDKLIQKILSPEAGLRELISSKGTIVIVSTDGERETIILRDKDEDGNKKLVEYEDTEKTIQMRNNLSAINQKLVDARIILNVTNEQYDAMNLDINTEKDPERRTIDFSNKQLCRIFNQSSFNKGGRFYGGWWQNIPRKYRTYIEIDNWMAVEIDYSGHHFRILYAEEGLKAPDDPYDLEGYDRDVQKEAALIMLNASDNKKAYKAMARKGIRGAEKLASAIRERHTAVSKHFFTGVGLDLMYSDSRLAERILLKMIVERGITVLPIHDSFIVRESHTNELLEIMKSEFERMFGVQASIKFKVTAREEFSKQNKGFSMFTNTNFSELMHELVDIKKSKIREIWGS